MRRAANGVPLFAPHTVTNITRSDLSGDLSEPFALSLSKGFDRLSPNGVV